MKGPGCMYILGTGIGSNVSADLGLSSTTDLCGGLVMCSQTYEVLGYVTVNLLQIDQRFQLSLQEEPVTLRLRPVL